MKFRLKPECTSPVEVTCGNFSQRFAPGVEVEITSPKFAAYLIAQGLVDEVVAPIGGPVAAAVATAQPAGALAADVTVAEPAVAVTDAQPAVSAPTSGGEMVTQPDASAVEATKPSRMKR